MSIFRKWRPRAEGDEDALRKVLEGEPPLGAADIPVQINFGWGGALGQLFSFFAPALGLLLVHIVFALDLRWALFLGGIFSLFNLASAVPDFTSLIRAITISAEGVRVEKIHRSYVIPWWRVRSMQATPDLLNMRVIGWEERALISTETLEPDKRVDIAHGLRARARQHGVDLEEWPRGDRIRRQIIPGIVSIAGVVAVVAGIYFWFPGGTLGMRCSANSAFLQETFGTPNRQGCVVLRVSAGAENTGIQRGDLVIEMEGTVTSGQQFQYIFDTTDPPWTFAIIRSGLAQPLQFKVRGGRGENFREDADDPFFYYLRARWDASEKPQQAIRDYSRAIELEPRFDLAYLYRGDLHKEAGDPEAARKDYRMALEISPDLGEAHSHYAYFVDDEDPLTAEEHIRRAIELNGCAGGFQEHNIDCADNYVLLASLLFADPSEMARVAEQGISFFDGFADNYFNAMCAHSYLGDDGQAKSYADRYLKFSKSMRTPERTAIAEGVREGTGEC